MQSLPSVSEQTVSSRLGLMADWLFNVRFESQSGINLRPRQSVVHSKKASARQWKFIVFNWELAVHNNPAAFKPTSTEVRTGDVTCYGRTDCGRIRKNANHNFYIRFIQSNIRSTTFW